MVTENMWAQAHAIASAHGHMWANSIPAHLVPALWGTDVWRPAAESGCAWPCGRAMPVVTEDSIGDSTATGRLRWDVFDGKWVLAVHRPELGMVLCVDSDGYTANHEAVRGGKVHIRHLKALVPALKALGAFNPESWRPDWVALAGRFAHDMEPAAAATWFAQLGAEHGAMLADLAQHELDRCCATVAPSYRGRVVDEEV